LVHTRGVMKVAPFTKRFQVSGVPPKADQRLKLTRWMGVAHELDFLSPLVTFSLNPSRIEDSGRFLLTPET